MESVRPRSVARGIVAVLVVALVLTCAGLTFAYEPPQLGAGTIENPANSTTVVAVQGFHWEGEDNPKKPARLLLANATANITQLQDDAEENTTWFYDVDPLDNGNLLVTSTIPGDTIVYELNATTKERVWSRRFDATDTHDVDLINGDELLFANMREFDENESVSNDRVFVYNLTRDEIVWKWQFKNHYPESTDGGFGEDWTHVNDVDKIGDGRYLVSPRNFDQVIVIDRATKEIEMRLGRDGDHTILAEQHNPDYLEGPDGTPTILVADSENDRIVEYVRECGDADPRLGAGTPPGECEWELVWELGVDQFNWPRDADRLPNGNTLITDSQNHRVIEVTPWGEIVWEVHAPWGPYDAERVRWGGGSNGPTMQELGVGGRYELNDSEANNASSGGAAGSRGSDRISFPDWLKQTAQGLPFAGAVGEFAEFWEGTSQWIKPIWMAPWGFVALVGAVLLTVMWAVAEIISLRDHVFRLVRLRRSAE